MEYQVLDKGYIKVLDHMGCDKFARKCLYCNNHTNKNNEQLCQKCNKRVLERISGLSDGKLEYKQPVKLGKIKNEKPTDK